MKNLYVLIIALLFLFLTFFYIQKVKTKSNNIEWDNTVEIIDPGQRLTSRAVFSIINPNNVIFAWPGTLAQGYTNINIYIKEIRNKIFSPTINFTNSYFNSRYPKLIIDKKGIKHLFYGYSSAPPDTRSAVHPTDIYYSYNNNGLWSDTVNLFHLDTAIAFRSFPTIKLGIDSKNCLHFVLQADSSKGPKLFHRIEKDFKWSEINVITIMTANWDFMIDKNDKFHMVIEKPEYSGGYDENSVYYCYSIDYGYTWSTPVLVHKSGSQAAKLNKILIDQSQNIHIIWTKNISGNPGGPDVIYHSYSQDGVKWLEAKNIVPQLTDHYLYIDAVCDKNNRIHLVYDLRPDFLGWPSDIYYTCWNGKSWSTTKKIFEYGQMPAIAMDDLGFLHLVYWDSTGNTSYTRTKETVVTVENERNDILPDKFELYQNFPNPFNPSTVINFQLPIYSHIKLIIYDIQGREVTRLIDEFRPAGNHSVKWDAKNLPSGIYYYRLVVSGVNPLQAGYYSESKKMIYLK